MTDRAGYTVTMFLVDVSPSMGRIREVEVPLPNGEAQIVEMTNLEWSIQFVKLKIQEMIYNGRKTEQCGIILFGTEETNNVVNRKDDGYEHVYEYIPVGQPNAGTLAKLSDLQPSTEVGDPIDALIVGIETQHQYLAKKKTWTRKMVLLTDGENPIEIEDWMATAKKMNDLDIQLAIIGIDFDDPELPFHEESKPDFKRGNEEFYHAFVEKLESGVVGNCAFALQEIARPEVKSTKSALLGTILRLGDTQERPDEAIELPVKISKCTALARPKSWKKFGRRVEGDDVAMHNTDQEHSVTFAQLSMRTEYIIDHSGEEEEEEAEKAEEEAVKKAEVVEKEQLVRGFKYGSSYVPCPDGAFPRLETKKGIDFCGFFPSKYFRRELSIGEVQYLWADPGAPVQQVALSSIVQAMYEKGAMAIVRWVSRDGADPKMGVLAPTSFEEVDCFLWVQMPFADDVRKYTFPSLERLVNKNGELVTKHPYLPTDEQMAAMENFVDAMDLMEAGEEDDEGNRRPWFDTRLSYNPAIHRTKQAQLHAAVVTDLKRQPLPPPHPELLKYFDPPKKVVKRARPAIEETKKLFKVREVPKRVVRARKDGHVHARDDTDDALVLDGMPAFKKLKQSQSQTQLMWPESTKAKTVYKIVGNDSDSETEPEDEEELMLERKGAPVPETQGTADMLPTPERSMAPDDHGRAPGRIISSLHPLNDLQENLKQGDLVSKVVEDLAFVIKHIAGTPFTEDRTDELIECMKIFRTLALEEDEIDAWNTFLQELRILCLEEDPGNLPFWIRVTDLGRSISLISQPEAQENNGQSTISEARAKAFIRSPR